MFEHFTDRARKIVALANQQAIRMNRDHIDTEHVLLGLIVEGSGVGMSALKKLHVDVVKMKAEVERITPTGAAPVAQGKLPQTAAFKRAIEYSMAEAQSLNHNYVGSEHMLLGLIRENDGVAAQVLRNLQVRLDPLRESILRVLALEGREA